MLYTDLSQIDCQINNVYYYARKNNLVLVTNIYLIPEQTNYASNVVVTYIIHSNASDTPRTLYYGSAMWDCLQFIGTSTKGELFYEDFPELLL